MYRAEPSSVQRQQYLQLGSAKSLAQGSVITVTTIHIDFVVGHRAAKSEDQDRQHLTNEAMQFAERLDPTERMALQLSSSSSENRSGVQYALSLNFKA